MKKKKLTARDWQALARKIVDEHCDISGPARCSEHYTAKLRKIEGLLREMLGE